MIKLTQIVKNPFLIEHEAESNDWDILEWFI